MSNIDYEAAVKAVYADAVCKHIYLGWRVTCPQQGRISGFEYTKERAWQAAYQLLKQQGKI